MESALFSPAPAPAGRAPAATAGTGPVDLLAAQLPFDLAGAAFRSDPYPFFERLRSEAGPVHRTASGALVVLGHRECAAALRNPSLGHGAGSARQTTGYGMPARSFLRTDPPHHTDIRRLVSGAFTPQAGLPLRPLITQHLHALLDSAYRRERVDVVTDIAQPLAMGVISHLLGIPADEQDRFQQCSGTVIDGMDPASLVDERQRRQAAQARITLVQHLRLHLRRTEEAGPGAASSVLARLAAPVSPDTGPLPITEAIATAAQLLAAGYETTVALISNGLHALLTHPRQLGHLTATGPDEQAMQQAVEELLRYEPPVQLTLRVALAPTTVGGQHVPEGTVTLLALGAANRDPDVYDRPHDLDVTRDTQHLSFGLGPHFCLGAPLARLEARLALDALLRCRPILVEEEVSYVKSVFTRSVQHLRVRLTGPPSP
ncbi:cytochrome P450 [Kitasatospora sp. NBC_01287]|uniref:cytochrome P450 n=1 Tax=Kitasatospora sp. NBC_01287 TaxID=2903573 RepID=UPI00224CA12C|nr:cytochrome P450 [Kitasatospora sp. NBC_01287]MCX4745726.1 cytochrome P450 [Kitasatospora sp. NBC_01287]